LLFFATGIVISLLPEIQRQVKNGKQLLDPVLPGRLFTVKIKSQPDIFFHAPGNNVRSLGNHCNPAAQSDRVQGVDIIIVIKDITLLTTNQVIQQLEQGGFTATPFTGNREN
jgi:hypothetical protein